MESIKHDLEVSADPGAAFAAVATPAGIKGWWARNSEVGTSVGSRTTLHFTKPDMSATMTFDVSALEPGRTVEWTCVENTNPIWPGSKLRWEVEPRAGGSTVHFEHDGFSSDGPLYDATVQGWQLFMDSLEAYLNGKQATPSD